MNRARVRVRNMDMQIMKIDCIDGRLSGAVSRDGTRLLSLLCSADCCVELGPERPALVASGEWQSEKEQSARERENA